MTRNEVPPDLAPSRIAARLRTERFGRTLEVHADLASTMDRARELADRGAPDGTVVLADSQHRGRGSQGRTWHSPEGKDLYLSILARPDLPASARPLVSLAVGLGVAEAAETLSGGAHAEVKWPNDVRLLGRKCAGILVEARSVGDRFEAVIGIGLDVNRRVWEPELRDVAISIAEARADRAEVNRTEAFATLVESVERFVDVLATRGPRSIVSALDARLALRGKPVRCDDLRGTLVGIAESGAILIRNESGLHERVAGRLEADL